MNVVETAQKIDATKIKLVLIAVLMLLITFPLYSQSWEWVSLPDMPTARYGHCSIVYHDKVWNIGGKDELNVSLNSVDCFNLQTGQWETNIPKLNYPRFNAAAVVYQDKIFVIGGHNSHQTLNSVEYYDPNLNQWQEFAPLLHPREGMNAFVFEEKLYVLGGLKDTEPFSVPLDMVEFWDDSTQKWRERPDWKLQKPRAFMQSVVLDNFVYTLGGFWIDEQLDLNERFGSSSGTESMTPLPSPRYYFSAVLVQYMIYVIGGIRVGDFKELHDSIDIYEPVLDQWDTLRIPMTKPKVGLTAISYHNSIYVFGGMDSDQSVLKTAEYLKEMATVVNREKPTKPTQHRLLNNYPNPFNAVTTISLQIATREPHLTLVIFNLKGERVRTYELNSFAPGHYQIQWDGCDENGRTVESGIYLAQLRSDLYQGSILKLSFIK